MLLIKWGWKVLALIPSARSIREILNTLIKCNQMYRLRTQCFTLAKLIVKITVPLHSSFNTTVKVGARTDAFWHIIRFYVKTGKNVIVSYILDK